MHATDFIQLVTQGDDAAALAALQQSPVLASARDAQGVSVLCLAAYRHLPALTAALAAARSDLDIFEASCVGDVDCVIQRATAEPACVNDVSPDGFSPVGYSAFFGHVVLLQELIRRGGAVGSPSRNAMRVCPIHSAAVHADQAKAVVLARLVLEAGADPNAVQQGGYTALHQAALNGNLPLITLLLHYRADATLANDKGTTAIDLARSNGHEEAVRLLEAAATPEPDAAKARTEE